MGGPHFFQTRTPPHPPWLRTATLSYPRTGKTFQAPVVDDLAGLVWAVNLTTVELHPFLGRLPDLAGPTALVLDLDPGAPALARRLAGRLAETHPDLVVERMTKALRAGKVLVDWSQNDAGKSTVAPWSVRGQPVPTVSMPVAWDEVEDAVRRHAAAHLVFGLADVAGRAAHGDAFSPVLAGGQTLPS